MVTEDMSSEEMLDEAEKFHVEFKALVHKYVGEDINKAPPLMLAYLQERTSVFQPWIWS